MKKASILGLAMAVLLVSCQSASGDKAATNSEQQVAEQKGATYTVETGSSLKWKGYHKGGLNPRFGILKAEGTVSSENGSISGGTFVVDVNSILTDAASVDPATSGGKTSLDLDGHLKSADFFEAEKYPTVKFEITGVTSFDPSKDKSVVEGATNIVSGNLTIKDKTVNVSFPAKVAVTDNEVSVESKFTINRQDWGLTYGTDGGDPKDWMISQEVDIDLNIKAKK